MPRSSVRLRCARASLVVALAGAGTLACTALLEFDGLDSETNADAGVPNDALADGQILADARPTADGPPSTRSYRDEVIADGPVSYWRFGEEQGPSAIDETGSAHGAYRAAPVLGVEGAIAGDPNTAWRTDPGDAGGMTAGAGSAFAFSDRAPFTLEIWMRPTHNDANFRMIFQRRADDASGRQEYALYVNNGKVAFHRYVDDVRIGLSTVALVDGAWRHVVATYNGAALTLYVDGAAVGTEADTRSAVPTSGVLFVGVSTNFGIPFLGTLDEAAVYAKELDGSRVRAHFDAARRAAR